MKLEGIFRLHTMQFRAEAESIEELLALASACDEINRAIELFAKRVGVPVEEVRFEYRRNVQGQHGRFDMLLLRAFKDGRVYSLSIGKTDNNPLGIYVSRNPERIRSFTPGEGDGASEPVIEETEAPADDDALFDPF